MRDRHMRGDGGARRTRTRRGIRANARLRRQRDEQPVATASMSNS